MRYDYWGTNTTADWSEKVMRGLRKALWSSICLSLMLILTTFTPALAHEGLIRSAPAADERLAEAPSQVTLWFDGELVTQKSTLKVFDADGQQVDAGDGHVDLNDPDHASMIVTLPPLPEGIYTVKWRVVYIEDGDVVEGKFDFIVGNATPRIKSTLTIAPPAESTPPITSLTPATSPTPATSNIEESTPGWLPIGMVAGVAIVVILIVLSLMSSRKTRHPNGD